MELDTIFKDIDFDAYGAYKHQKMKKFKYRDRFKNRACPVCGSNNFEHMYGHAKYPEVCNWDVCSDCGCVVAFEDNSPWIDIWHEIKKEGVRSKKKVLDIVRSFYSPNKNIEKIYG